MIVQKQMDEFSNFKGTGSKTELTSESMQNFPGWAALKNLAPDAAKQLRQEAASATATTEDRQPLDQITIQKNYLQDLKEKLQSNQL